MSNITQPLGWIGDIAIVEPGGRLNLKCPNGLHGSMDFHYIEIVPDSKNPNRVKAIWVYQGMASRQTTAAAALALAKQWNMPNTQPIEDFRLKRTFEYGRDDAWFDTLSRGPDGKWLDPQPSPFYFEIKAFGGPPQYQYALTFVAVLDGPIATTQAATTPTP